MRRRSKVRLADIAVIIRTFGYQMDRFWPGNHAETTVFHVGADEIELSCRNQGLTDHAYNIIVVIMIPGLVPLVGAPWKVLPPGIHPATLSEVEAAFAINPPRRGLFAGLIDGAANLRWSGCVELYLDGSFVTAKPIPGDYDACWDPAGVDPKKLDPVFFDFSNLRQAQKTKFKGEYFPSTLPNKPNQPFLDFFQIERFSGGRKGIVSISLAKEPTLTRRANP